MKYSILLKDAINREKQGIDYRCAASDKELLRELFNEIKCSLNVDIFYLAELDAFYLRGSGEIIARYIKHFSAESVKAYLIPQIVQDKIKEGDQLILELYRQFKKSEEYALTSSAHIYVRYDNAFYTMKSKRIKYQLIDMIKNPRDAYYLPLTIKMLASWKLPEVKDILLSYASLDSMVARNNGYKVDIEELDFVKRQLIFTAIKSLKYYPEDVVLETLKEYAQHQDKDIRVAAQKVVQKLCV